MTLSRRRFLKQLVAGAALSERSAVSRQEPFDQLIRGGHVVDPSQGLSAVRDVAIRGRTIARVADGIPETASREVIDATGKIVTPGLIDAHVHVYEGVAGVAIDPDVACVARGATTVLDAGSAGAVTFDGFRQYVIERATTRVFSLLNASSIGLASLDEVPKLGYIDTGRSIETIEANRDLILGVKIRMTRSIGDRQELDALRMARDIVDAVSLPLMVHIGPTHSPLRAVLAELRPGDVVTHALRAHGSVLDERGALRPEVIEARERGIWFDVGHGAGNFSFDTAERAVDQGFVPDMISSDVHSRNFNGPVYDLATTLSKFLFLGLTLEQVIESATTNPARIFPLPVELGTMREGREADIAMFDLEDGEVELVDSTGARRLARQRLVPDRTFKAGALYRRDSDNGHAARAIKLRNG